MARTFLQSIEREFRLEEVSVSGRPSLHHGRFASAPTSRYQPSTFDRPSAEPLVEAPAPPPPSYSEAELEAAVAEARAEAIVSTRQAIRDELEGSLAAREAAILETLGSRLDACQAEFEAVKGEIRAHGRELIVEVTRAVAPRALARAPLPDVEVLLEDLVPRLGSEPRLELRLPSELIRSGQELLGRIAAASRYQGEIVVEADPSLTAGDARLVWRRGEAERETATLIEQALSIAKSWLEAGAMEPAVDDDNQAAVPAAGQKEGS